MIVTNLKGGLGNQLFQYATSKALSLSLGHDLKVTNSTPRFFSSSRQIVLTDIFNLQLEYSSFFTLSRVLRLPFPSFLSDILSKKRFTSFHPRNFIVEPSYNYWPELFNLKNKNIFLYGYWQSYKYFIEFFDFFKKDFLFNEIFLNENIKNLYLSQIKHENSISIHFRRGDYVTNNSSNNFHGVCDMFYYKKSVAYIIQKVHRPHFFIFSDDIQWVKSNLTFIDCPTTYVEGNSDIVDFWLMSLCKHNILANSTFSWWAAWLNANKNKIITAPRRWFVNPYISTDDLIPLDWHRF